ncbi:hypothetical protein LCGC14_1323460 [marine sediment metagenome]|uniref:Uncharacterized protein n=1 Tax=marine sediment metagenome TaxID=412755 RepID=A0A0F9KJA3_9ZZZZ
MAVGTPIRQGGFLQQTGERRVRKNISNFRVRTGQKFGDIAATKLFERELVQSQEEKQQQARTALQFRQQEETERQARVREEQRGQVIEQEKDKQKQDRRAALNRALFGDFGPIADAFT